jgi:hypothetical protein
MNFKTLLLTSLLSLSFVAVNAMSTDTTSTSTSSSSDDSSSSSSSSDEWATGSTGFAGWNKQQLNDNAESFFRNH